jgi:hypothetical protein
MDKKRHNLMLPFLKVWISIHRSGLDSSFPFVALARDFVVINPARLETGR